MPHASSLHPSADLRLTEQLRRPPPIGPPDAPPRSPFGDSFTAVASPPRHPCQTTPLLRYAPPMLFACPTQNSLPTPHRPSQTSTTHRSIAATHPRLLRSCAWLTRPVPRALTKGANDPTRGGAAEGNRGTASAAGEVGQGLKNPAGLVWSSNSKGWSRVRMGSKGGVPKRSPRHPRQRAWWEGGPDVPKRSCALRSWPKDQLSRWRWFPARPRGDKQGGPSPLSARDGRHWAPASGRAVDSSARPATVFCQHAGTCCPRLQ